MILQIALDTPLRRIFDYRPPAHWQGMAAPPLGVRVRVPFGRRQLIGILVGVAGESAVAAPKLKAALDILDERPVVDPVTFDLLRWAADYYHHPLGEVFAAALPVSLRAGQAALQTVEWWCVSPAGTARIVGSQRAARSATASPARLARGARPSHRRRGGVVPSSRRNCGRWRRAAGSPSGGAAAGGAHLASQRSDAHRAPSAVRRRHPRLPAPLRGTSPLWRDRQRQDRGVFARHRRRNRRRRPGSGAGARDRVDAAAGGPLSPPLQLRGGGAAFGLERR